MGVEPEICDALERAGITTPFAIQEMTLSVALLGTDLIGQARTGTGKTLAFGIPVLQRSVAPSDPAYADMPQGKPQALIVAPTRELALQVSGDLPSPAPTWACASSPSTAASATNPARGPRGRRRHRRRHPGPPDRPGQPPRPRPLPRARARPRRGRRDARPRLPARRHHAAVEDARDAPDDAVLGDHAGRDRRPGAHPHAPPDEHPRRVVLRNAMVPATAQFIYQAHDLDKPEIIGRVLQAEDAEKMIVFTRTKRQAQRVAEDLAERGFQASPLHGDMAQVAREKALASSARTRSRCWSPPTSRPAASTCAASPTSSTTPAPRTTRPTSTASAAPAAPAPRASRSPSSTGPTCTAGR